VILLGGGELYAGLKGPLQMLFPNAQITEAYGMTEACSSITFRSLDMPHCTAASGGSSQVSGSSAAIRAGQRTDRKRSEVAEQRAGSMLDASAGASNKHGLKIGAGAIPVGRPPPGIEMGVAPVSMAANGACREPVINDTEVEQSLPTSDRLRISYLFPHAAWTSEWECLQCLAVAAIIQTLAHLTGIFQGIID
jgi:acyl-CoA synthetase (AMP-forming)/AMP-acid ligase II